MADSKLRVVPTIREAARILVRAIRDAGWLLLPPILLALLIVRAGLAGRRGRALFRIDRQAMMVLALLAAQTIFFDRLSALQPARWMPRSIISWAASVPWSRRPHGSCPG